MRTAVEGDVDESDVLVVGGGISGLALALVAAGQGWRVALLEAGDFGGGATANSLRIVHGGLRYLQTLNLERARRSIRARRSLMRFAPDIVRPFEVRIPTARWGLRSRVPLSMACMLADVLGMDRNSGLTGQDRLPGCRVWQRTFLGCEQAHESQVPAIAWWDAMLSSPGRLIARLVLRCKAYGVQLRNYAQVTQLIQNDRGHVSGAWYESGWNGAVGKVSCKVVIDASGHGGREFRERIAGCGQLCDWVGAANFLLDENSSGNWGTGLLAHERDGLDSAQEKLGKKRDFFFVPTPAGTLVGTTYVLLNQVCDVEQSVSRAFDQLLDEINRARPHRPISAGQVKHVFWGLLPAAATASGSASSRLLNRDLLVDGARAFGISGYCRVQAVKFTTAFELAAEAIPIIRRYCPVSPAGHAPDVFAPPTQPETSRVAVLAKKSPGEIKATLRDMNDDAIGALVHHCVFNEYALTLEDVLQRRLGLLPADYPDEVIRRALAGEMATLLEWNDRRTEAELALASDSIVVGPRPRADRETGYAGNA